MGTRSSTLAGFVLAHLLAVPLQWASAQSDTELKLWQEQGSNIERLVSENRLQEALDASKQRRSFAASQWGQGNYRTLRTSRQVGKITGLLGDISEAQHVFADTLASADGNLGADSSLSFALRDDLATLYKDVGRFQEAYELLGRNLNERRDKVYIDARDGLAEELNLGAVHVALGKLAMAEKALRQGLETSVIVLGAENDVTTGFKRSLAELMQSEERFDEADKLYSEALDVLRRQGSISPDPYIDTLANYGTSLWEEGKLDDAEVILREILDARLKSYPSGHPKTIGAMNNLAGLLIEKQRYADAEELLQSAYEAASKTLEPDHRSRLLSEANLGRLLATYGSSAEGAALEMRQTLGEALMRDALERQEHVLGASHPATRTVRMNLVIAMAAQGRVEEAADLQEQLEGNILQWVGEEYRSSESAAARKRLVASQETYQDVALSLARRYGSSTSRLVDLAASALLHFKNIGAEEEAALARLTRASADPVVRNLALAIQASHAQMARAVLDDSGPQRLGELTRLLDAQENQLGQLSTSFSSQLKVRGATMDQLRRAMPPRSALLEFRFFVPVDLATGQRTEGVHLAGVLISPVGTLMRDLGPAEPIETAVRDLMVGPDENLSARGLYVRVLAPFEADLRETDRLYVAPDGPLYLVPFGLLQDGDGTALLVNKDVRLLQTGRDLLRAAPTGPGRGIVALGGIDFNVTPPLGTTTSVTSACEAAPSPDIPPPWDDDTRQFRTLPHSADEAREVAALYCAARQSEPVEVDVGGDASKARLLRLPWPPRVLHLATHGFFAAKSTRLIPPMLRSGVALAGANVTEPDGRNGILYAQEAQDLDLDGTELVVLSACDTAQGSIDYGDGLSGLIRAFRTAGARSIIVSLRPVGNLSSAEFMKRFYSHWLGDANGDAAVAMRATQKAYLDESRSATTPGSHRDVAPSPPTWSSFILVGP